MEAGPKARPAVRRGVHRSASPQELGHLPTASPGRRGCSKAGGREWTGVRCRTLRASDTEWDRTRRPTGRHASERPSLAPIIKGVGKSPDLSLVQRIIPRFLQRRGPRPERRRRHVRDRTCSPISSSGLLAGGVQVTLTDAIVPVADPNAVATRGKRVLPRSVELTTARFPGIRASGDAVARQ